MSSLTATVRVGPAPPLGGGIEPVFVAHLYEGAIPRFIAYEVETDGSGPPAMEPVGGAYAPAVDEDPSYPVTDLLLALDREASAITQRLDTLSEKARANAGRPFEAMVFNSDVAWGSDGYGRLFEARSQLEAHGLDHVVAVSALASAGDPVRDALAANLARLDGPTRWLPESSLPVE